MPHHSIWSRWAVLRRTIMGDATRPWLHCETEKSDAGFSRSDLLIVAGILLIFSIGLVLTVAWFARRSLVPFLLLTPGQPVAEVPQLVGEPKYRTKDLSLVRDRSEVPSFSCQRLGESLPGLLSPIFSDTASSFGPSSEFPLPVADGEILVFFPFLYEVLVYTDDSQKVTTVLYCCT